MGTDVTFALIGPLLGVPLLLAYSLPVAALAVSGPWILRSRRRPVFWLLFFAVACLAGVLVSVVGGLHRQAMGTGGPSLFSAVLAAVSVAVLMSAPTAVLHFLARRGWSPRKQASAALLAGLAVLILASPILLLYVSCVASGECV